MAHHVFTEDQTTMEWYIDGIPVAELKRRYEAHDALVKSLKMPQRVTDEMVKAAEDVGDLYRLGQPEIIRAAIRAALAAAEVRNG